MKGNEMKVKNLISNSGNPVANQFVIEHQNHSYFQSYESIIAKKSLDHYPLYQDLQGFEYYVQLDEKFWNYSKTTSKYRNQFLGETTKETQAKINNGQYILTNLNTGK